MARKSAKLATATNDRYTIVEVAGDKRITTEVEADDIAYDVFGIRRTGKKTTVDHIPTGLKIVSCRTISEARWAVRELIQISDFKWTEPPKNIREAVGEILRKYAA